MEDTASKIVDLYGAIYRNLVRDESDQVDIGSDSRSAILSILRRRGGCSMTELSRALRVAKSNITFLVDRLEEQGLLARQHDPADRRKTIIQLTEQGRAEIEQRRTLVLARIEARLARLDQADRAYLEETLPRMLQILARLYAAAPEETVAVER